MAQSYEMAMWKDHPFPIIYHDLRRDLLEKAPAVQVGEWHAMNVGDNPMAVTRELRGVTLHTNMGKDKVDAQGRFRPNLPWAEDQFQERVSGIPHNPGETYKHWPWQSKMTDHTKEQGQFSHTYMERYWPKRAGEYAPEDGEHMGIRFGYGDLGDVVDLLAASPYSRQAVLPVWFPEDTGNRGVRLPCSLTYHFLLRDDRLHCEYSIRSCDFMRHFRDDVYMTARLTQWILHELQQPAEPLESTYATPQEEIWANARPGTLTMHIGSLHIMEGDVNKLERERKGEENARQVRILEGLS